MEDATRRKAEDLFQRVVVLSAAERAEFLDRHSHDPQVRAEVEALLAHDAACGSASMGSLPDTFPMVEDMRGLMDSLARGPLLEGRGQLGDFRIVRQIGRGGMGTVYEAMQERLGRRVALKVLPRAFALDPELVERFRREARATASIHHPSIVPIYEVGEAEGVHYYAMEFIEGPSLDLVITQARERAEEARRSSPATDAAYVQSVIEQVATLAEGLQEAHAQGLVHRDIKPANILVGKNGRYVLADFGLVRDVRADTLTHSGQMLGTLSYMSPEQVSCREVGPPTDVYSLGVTLFELLTLRRFFEGKSAHEIESAILYQEPPSPRKANAKLHRDIETVILHCLQKQPERRYATAGELAAELRRILRFEPIVARPQPLWERVARRAWRQRRRIAAVTVFAALAAAIAYLAWPQRITSLAVLPFATESGAPEVEYVSAGLTDSLIFRLGQLPGLQVKSRSVVGRYQGQDVKPQEVGRDLQVDAVLTGRLLRSGEDLTVRVELVNTQTNGTIWGERYERKPEPFDLQELEEDIAAAIVDGLKVVLSGENEQRLRKRHTRDREAYLLYQQGRHLFSKYTEEDFQKCLEYFQRAIDRDPQFALAHVGMAECYIVLGNDFRAPKEVLPLGLDHALQAAKLDPMLGEAHAALGAIRLYYDWDWKAAERELTRALELNPRCAESFPCYLHCLDAMGRPADAKRHVEQTLLNVDPSSLILQAELGCTTYYGRRYDEAIESCQTTLRLQDDYIPALYNLGRAYGQVKKYDEAIQALNRALGEVDANFILAELAYVYASSGKREKAEEILAKLLDRKSRGFVDPYIIAFVHIGLGDEDKALESLREALAVRSTWVPWLRVEPKFFGLHADPRFQDLLRGLNLPSA
jgi:serine/threonine-protein kinase